MAFNKPNGFQDRIATCRSLARHMTDPGTLRVFANSDRGVFDQARARYGKQAVRVASRRLPLIPVTSLPVRYPTRQISGRADGPGDRPVVRSRLPAIGHEANPRKADRMDDFRKRRSIGTDLDIERRIWLVHLLWRQIS